MPYEKGKELNLPCQRLNTTKSTFDDEVSSNLEIQLICIWSHFAARGEMPYEGTDYGNATVVKLFVVEAGQQPEVIDAQPAYLEADEPRI